MNHVSYSKIVERLAKTCLVLAAVLLQPIHLTAQQFNRLELWGDDGNGGATTDWQIYPQGPGTNFTNTLSFFREGVGLSSLNITDAPAGAANLHQNGFGIGFGAFNQTANPPFPSATLHVVGGGTSDAYPNAFTHIQDRSSTAAFRELLRLTNNSGGGTRFTMVDAGSGNASYTLDNFGGAFNLFNGTTSQVPIQVAADSGVALRVAMKGVGIGLNQPETKLHLRSDGTDPNDPMADAGGAKIEVTPSAGSKFRTMLDLKNHGGNFMTFEDTSQAGRSVWFFSNSNDEFLITKGNDGVQNINPGLRILADGTAFFRANQAPRFTIFPNGDVRPGNGGSYLNPSDRNLKDSFEEVDTEGILKKLVEMPITSWVYKDDDQGRRHIGPMAQDFHSAFRLGNDQTTISAIDEHGVALAAIQGLNQKVDSKNAEIATLTESLENQSKQLKNQSDLIEDQFEMIQELTRRMESLESQLAPENK